METIIVCPEQKKEITKIDCIKYRRIGSLSRYSGISGCDLTLCFNCKIGRDIEREAADVRREANKCHVFDCEEYGDINVNKKKWVMCGYHRNQYFTFRTRGYYEELENLLSRLPE